MKHICLFLALSLLTIVLYAFECDSYGPVADEISCALLDQEPEAYGAVMDGNHVLILRENGEYHPYMYCTQGLPISGLCWRDANTLMISMGAGTWSDGVYNFDLATHQWSVNEWFFWPNFITYCPDNSTYYIGDRQGLYQSTDAATWNRIEDLGNEDCRSLAWFGQMMICNMDNGVFISSDGGVQWQQAGMGLLEKFRFTDNGTLYGIMDDFSDSDGLWRSHDYGQNWEVVFYASALSCLGPNFDDLIPVAFHGTSERDNYLALLNGNDELNFLTHEDLGSGISEIGIFPLINTPSFYVINASGLHYITDFGATSNDEPLAGVPEQTTVKVYPNPATKDCRIMLSDGKPIREMKVYNLRGQLLRTLCTPGKEQHWDLRDDQAHILPAGVYILRAKSDTPGQISTARVLIR
ncbi:MAG TPA: T9SS type A sorting domain-containing protein [Candidatus Cloacimonadota bacterium]|nr:T9SS type A sorting domain-containing protein [Candidatus Cloacimonadota bacterium]